MYENTTRRFSQFAKRKFFGHCGRWYTSLQMNDQGYLKLGTADFKKKVATVYLTARCHSPKDDSLKAVTVLCAQKRCRSFETLKISSLTTDISHFTVSYVLRKKRKHTLAHTCYCYYYFISTFCYTININVKYIYE